MESTMYECGCWVTRDMFNHRILSIEPCEKHREAVYSHSYKEITEDPGVVWGGYNSTTEL